MADKNLSRALGNLIARGELSQEAAEKLLLELSQIDKAAAPRRGVISEVGGYLGGLFILISVLLLVNGRWQHLSRLTDFLLFIFTALLLFGAARVIGNSSGPRSRLTGLLTAAASASVSISLITVQDPGHKSVAIAILIGWFLDLTTYISNRTIIGELSLAPFSIALGLSGTQLLSPRFAHNFYAIGVVLLLFGPFWLLLATKRFFNRTSGYATAMAALFLAGQFIFNGEFRYFTYLIYIATVACASWLYSRTSEWPLLVGAVVAITVGTGEFVGATLGGSAGAALGLLTSGIIFVSGSAYSFRRVRPHQ